MLHDCLRNWEKGIAIGKLGGMCSYWFEYYEKMKKMIIDI